MATTILISKSNEEITTLMNKKFIPKLKTENDSTYFFSGKNLVSNEISEENTNSALNKMSFLFPSIPFKKIENIFKENKNISIEEGIEKLKELTLSENTKNQINKKECFPVYSNLNSMNFVYSRKFQKNFPNKRNYNCLLSQSNKIQGNQNTNNTFINYNIKNEFIINQKKIEKEREFQIQKGIEERQKESERIKERKKRELETVEKVARELLESKNLIELKEYLFGQLILLDQKKKKDNKNQQIKYQINNTINQLNLDKIELRKCNTVVTQALNKKIVEAYKFENKVRKLSEDINKVKESINYHEKMGDYYKGKLKEINGNL